ncbi:MAG: hypothetical protein GC159_19805 [Phycisphaera sp.]|nr:hypothetical protein [Phycisphaera sp.]
MINMICPQCGDELEIDEGFRGGVCRCFNCGMLMTVPDEPDAATQERVQAPPKRRTSAPSKRRSSAPAPRPASAPKPIRAQPVDMSTIDASSVPVARKRRPPRKSVKYSVWGVVGVFVLALIVAIIVTISVLFEKPPEVTPEQIYKEQFALNENPYTKGEPNFIGIDAGKRTVVMIDSSQSFANYIDYLKQMALRSVKTLRADQEIQFIFWRDGAPMAYPEEPRAAGQIKRDMMASQLDQVFATGGMKVAPAFQKAIAEKPDRLIIVAHQVPLPEELTGVADQLKKANIKTYVVLIDYPDPFFKKLAEGTGGQYIDIPAARLRRWYEEFLNQGGQPYTPGQDDAPATTSDATPPATK